MDDSVKNKTEAREVTMGRQSAYEPHITKTEVLSLQSMDNIASNPVSSSNNRGTVLEESTFQLIKSSTKNILSKYLKFIGPGIMVAVAYIDPGNYSTAVSAGASNEFSLLCIILLSNFIAIFLQCLCIKLGSVTGKDLSRNCHEHLPRWLNYTIYFFAECAIIATDVAEVIGTAIALNILIKVPLPAGVVITIVDVLTVMIAYKPGASSMRFVRYFEMGVALLVIGVCICFAIELAYIPKDTSARHVFRGFVPSSQMFDHNGMYTAISILGATVMPHSLFLGSGLVQPRLLDYDIAHNNLGVLTADDDGEEVEIGNSNAVNRDEEKKKHASREESMEQRYFNYRPTLNAIRYCMKYSMVELTLTLFTLALFVNCAILIVSGSTLYNTPNAADADLYAVHDLLSKNLAPAAGTIFMLALLLSGQSAGIVCTMAGQIVCEGHIDWKLAPWQRRLVTRCISIIPCLVISICIGKEAMNKALNASQVVLSIVLPFLVAPLIYFTCSKKIMKTDVTVRDSDLDITEQHLTQEDKTTGTIENENGTTIKVVNMANNWIVTIIAGIVWVFLSLLNVYAIVQLGITHGDIS
ncbi:similar to Saccharomyces cerevisiae YOL122C SMF1 Divalent metal ion transporter with a broad specificity for di-valent and tri-valent metals [Maudiozyma barnettii]|uniref:Similar to Saccharomyces cerevisiae YOL122C SMF1 Divalent metal ion transporter with a broad specificity for di-valent and tri-valent metals n=1 Tax=Maudiozyma barnettii TaxID=61262 RepID=A0A8H2VK60_9SACH|nr:divalent metal ion transporter SMF1 [Kazachstania barnettii]CAB4256800.1 similar to Saccharomyces cerevisiae YOL122C SMF1 Divalent metal ion transporter with a broad specificity for di-valent and tri-valent metals [Kazachstania barnettii]CAD1785453.1 similar to Saccharomyces cerevisiae YOL122C SMF1 Divalent metal ion transporter with a broad specificity for di-valent and tri-valent metals [Kazachstania barnettii]